ncbi:Hsp70 family protein [Paenarthrobacter ilicis]|uniref:Hsp70 family protein n=1 Tax=Paenarthrobacter ilicis TaxID=43665 RepID=UPI0028D8BA4E|nr:Hsp70 family protein [Paenarthrobacter ilicis]
MSYVLAIDVGTSFTAAALVRQHQGPSATPEILPLGLHGSAVPSVLFYAEDGRVLVGEPAERRGLDAPQRMVREFKRRIGDSVPLSVGDDWLAPEDVYATMAGWVVERAREREGSLPSSILMTHPAAWGEHRTSVVLAALNLGGLTDVTLISEPEAAALHYASQTRVDDGSVIAVYDLGGGTFDTAVLRKTGTGKFEFLGRPDGIETLGGADFDAAVLRHVMGHLGDAAAGLDPSAPGTLAALARLRRECREAKEALSMDSEASVAVSLPGTQQSIRLVRSEFEAMIEEPVHQTVDSLQRSLGVLGLQPEDVSAVLLIGGSSRIPLVAELISAELGRPIAVDADPKSSICLGAALAGTPYQEEVVEEPVAAAAAPAGRPPVRRRPASGTPGMAKPGRHAARPRVRLAASAAVAVAALAIGTATAAHSPEGTGLLASILGGQSADVMRDGGGQASGAKAPGAQAGGAVNAPAGTSPVVGGLVGGLEASAKAPGNRAGTGAAKSPAGQASGSGKGAVANGAAGNGGVAGAVAGGAGTGGAATPGTGTTPGTGSTPGTGTAPGTGTPATGNPGTGIPGTGTPGTGTPGTPGTGTPGTTTPGTGTPGETGGAASGPTPGTGTGTSTDPVPSNPPATTDPGTGTPTTPVTPAPTDPGTPPATDPAPSDPPPSTPAPEPTAPLSDVVPTQEPVPTPSPTDAGLSTNSALTAEG